MNRPYDGDSTGPGENSPWVQRLAKRTETLGIIDVNGAKTRYARTAGWLNQRTRLIDRLRSRSSKSDTSSMGSNGLILSEAPRHDHGEDRLVSPGFFVSSLPGQAHDAGVSRQIAEKGSGTREAWDTRAVMDRLLSRARSLSSESRQDKLSTGFGTINPGPEAASTASTNFYTDSSQRAHSSRASAGVPEVKIHETTLSQPDAPGTRHELPPAESAGRALVQPSFLKGYHISRKRSFPGAEERLSADSPSSEKKLANGMFPVTGSPNNAGSIILPAPNKDIHHSASLQTAPQNGQGHADALIQTKMPEHENRTEAAKEISRTASASDRNIPSLHAAVAPARTDLSGRKSLLKVSKKAAKTEKKKIQSNRTSATIIRGKVEPKKLHEHAAEKVIGEGSHEQSKLPEGSTQRSEAENGGMQPTTKEVFHGNSGPGEKKTMLFPFPRVNDRTLPRAGEPDYSSNGASREAAPQSRPGGQMIFRSSAKEDVSSGFSSEETPAADPFAIRNRADARSASTKRLIESFTGFINGPTGGSEPSSETIFARKPAIVWRKTVDPARKLFSSGPQEGKNNSFSLISNEIFGDSRTVLRQVSRDSSGSSPEPGVLSQNDRLSSAAPAAGQKTGIDIELLAEQVSYLISRRLEVEHERRGIGI